MSKAATLGLALASAILAASPGLAQGQKGRPAPKAPEPPPPPAIFPCRTAEEVCFLAVAHKGQVVVIYTNAPNSQGIDEKPIDAVGANGSKLDFGANEGRVVMLTGAYDAKTGLSKAEVVEVASPLASLAVKAQLGGGPPEGPPPGQKGAPAQKRR